jgi:serine/threonine-protein kinase RsbW
MTRRSREYALSLHFRSHPDNLPRVREKVFQLARRAGFNQIESKKVATSIEQSCLKIIETTYRNNTGLPILLRGIHHGDRIEFRVRDFGKKSDPRSLAEDHDMDQAEYDSSVSMGGELCLVKIKPTVVKPAAKRATTKRATKSKKRKK